MRELTLLLLSIALVAPACHARSFKGYGLSPVGWPSDWSKLGEFLKDVGDQEGGVLQNGPWRESVELSGVVPNAALLVAMEAPTFKYTPVQVVNWNNNHELLLNTTNDPTNDWTNTESPTLMKDMLVSLATNASLPTPYIFIGNENDMYYEQNPTDYMRWVAHYNEMYVAIKKAAPGTMVGPCFQYEHMSGNGQLNGWDKPHWGALTAHDFQFVDIVALTVYPFFNNTHASSIPSTYLDEVIAKLPADLPIAVTETGWPAEHLGTLKTPWVAGTDEQVTYVDKLFSLAPLQQGRAAFVNWLFLNQMSPVTGSSQLAYDLFGSIALRGDHGWPRPAYNDWLEA
jgi:hypothetical protein